MKAATELRICDWCESLFVPNKKRGARLTITQILKRNQIRSLSCR